jgi:hypothetical protein
MGRIVSARWHVVGAVVGVEVGMDVLAINVVSSVDEAGIVCCADEGRTPMWKAPSTAMRMASRRCHMTICASLIIRMPYQVKERSKPRDESGFELLTANGNCKATSGDGLDIFQLDLDDMLA